MNPKIIEYTENYQRDLLSMIIGLQNFERTYEKDRREGSKIAIDYLAELIEICNEKQGKIYLALADDQVAGYCSCFVQKDPDLITEISEWLYFCDLFVKKQYRNKGVSTKLINAVKNHAIQIKQKHIKLNVLTKNKHMQDVIAHNNFRSYEITYLLEI